MKILNFKYINLFLIALFVFAFSSSRVHAATLLSDDFTGTTIDTNKWNETDTGGAGGTTGNIQQNESLTITGGGWNTNYLVTDTVYDRSTGSLEMEADVICTSNGIVGIGYGDPGVLIGGGQSYTMYTASRVVYFSRQNANANAENGSTGFTCTVGVPFHIRITIGTSTGASLYINGSGTPAITLTGGTFNNKGFFIAGHSGSATTIDNFEINGPTLTVPDAPTGLSTTPSPAQMGLSWTAPSSDGGSAITDYIVEYKLSSEPTTWTTFSDGTSTATSTTVTGLTNGSSYDFRVAAVNSVGTSANSSTATATPNINAPSAPQSLSASSGQNMQSALTWTAPSSDGGSAITDYIVEYKLSSEPTTWTTFSDGTSTATSTTVTGLTNGSSYDFRVSAVNTIGTGSSSTTATATPNSYDLSDDFTGTTIDTSKWVESDSAGGGAGGLAGNVQQNGSLSATGNGVWGSNMLRTVETYTRDDGDITASVDVTIANCAGSDTMALSYGGHLTSNATYFAFYNGGHMNFTGFAPSEAGPISPAWSCTNGVPFNLKMVIVQAGGAKLYIDDVLKATITTGSYSGTFALQGLSSTTIFDNFGLILPTIGPESPSGLSATPDNGQVDLSWTAGGDNGSPITDYEIEYKLSTDGSWSTFSDGTSTSTSATVTGLSNGRNYNFRVSAVNGNGTSDPSGTSTAMPISGVATAPSASNVSIIGSAAVSELLTGSYTYIDVNGNTESGSTFRWLRAPSANGSYSAISGATNSTYTVTEDDIDMYLKFEVTPRAAIAPTAGSVELSSATAQVAELDYLNMILSTGQSLSVGVASSPVLSTTQSYSNKMLTGGGGGLGSATPLIALIESGVETMSSSIANSLTYNDPGNDLETVVGLHGASDYTYSQLKKGTAQFTKGITQVTNAKSAATALGRTLRVIGVTSIHGETDNFNGVSGATYQNYLEEWQGDYDTDVKAITGQTTDIPLFIDQMSSFMSSYANDATSEIPIYQLYAAEDNPGDIVLVTPKYFFNYSDRHHLTGASSRWLGEYYAKVIKKVAIDHEDWRPLSPDTVTRTGNVILADFHVPAGNLTFDTTLVSARTNKGFEYYDTTSSATISNVEIIDSNTVKITLSGTPTGSNQRLRYAYTGVPGTNTGAQNAGSAAGNLRDSDPYPSLYGNTLYNWAVHFDKAITEDASEPVISQLDSSSTTTTADITWNTDEAASTILEYGLDNTYGSTTTETDVATRVLSHSATIFGLVPCTTYHYRVKSKDAGFNEAVGADATFTTAGCTGSAGINDQTSSGITTAAGGSVSLLSDSKGIALTVPASFAGSDAHFQIKKLDKTATINATSTPTGYSVVGSYMYDLKALSDIATTIPTFDTPLTVTMTYGSADISGIKESTLTMYRWDGSSWNQLSGCSLDTSAKSVTCTTTSFSVFALFGQANSTSSSGSSANSSSTSTPTCQDQPPGSKTPWLYGAIPQDSSSILLYFTPADNPVSSYVLEYGTKSGEYPYGVQNMGVNADGQMTFLVKSLSPNTTYYFRVRASNGCATGNWSNELAAKTNTLITTNNLEFVSSELRSTTSESTKPSTSCQTHTVKANDTLWSLAANLLGDGSRYTEIIDQNKDDYPSLENSNNLKVGWELQFNCANDDKNVDKQTSDNGEKNSHEVAIRVLDTDKKPVAGAKVVLHSTPRETTTDEQGVARFTNVESGQHKVLVAYDGYNGEQSINLTEGVQKVELDITVRKEKFSASPMVYVGGGVLVILVLIGIVWTLRSRKK